MELRKIATEGDLKLKIEDIGFDIVIELSQP